MPWTKEEEIKLIQLRGQNNMFYKEIAYKLKKSPASVRWKAKKLKLPATQKTLDKYGKWNTKYAHLRGLAMKYFVTHTSEETRKRFNLTKSEFKSLFSAGYRMPEFKHLRKETRDHSAWTKKQLIFLLTHAGLKNRDWIAEKIGRGNLICIKERLQTLGLSSRTLQGLTMSQFIKCFGKRSLFYLQTKAGPNGGPKTSLPTRWKIIPWVWLNQEIKAKRLKTAPELKMLISARTKFQEWIFGGDALKKMKRIVSL